MPARPCGNGVQASATHRQLLLPLNKLGQLPPGVWDLRRRRLVVHRHVGLKRRRRRRRATSRRTLRTVTAGRQRARPPPPPRLRARLPGKPTCSARETRPGVALVRVGQSLLLHCGPLNLTDTHHRQSLHREPSCSIGLLNIPRVSPQTMSLPHHPTAGGKPERGSTHHPGCRADPQTNFFLGSAQASRSPVVRGLPEGKDYERISFYLQIQNCFQAGIEQKQTLSLSSCL